MTTVDCTKLIKLNMLCFVIFGITTTTIIEQNKILDHPDQMMRDLLRNMTTDYYEFNMLEAKVAETLTTALMRTSLLYVYLVLTLYYVILMEAEDLLSKPLALIGKSLVFFTIMSYFIAEYYLPTRNMYMVVTRLAIALLILSIMHLVLCLYESITWQPVCRVISAYYFKVLTLFLCRPRYDLVEGDKQLMLPEIVV